MNFKGSAPGTRWVRAFIIFIFLAGELLVTFNSSIAQTVSTQPEINAPGGAEIDVNQSITKWYGSKMRPVEVIWRNLNLKAYYLEYDRRREIMKCQDRVMVIQDETPPKSFSCGEMILELKRGFLAARAQIKLEYDDRIALTGNRLEWDQKKDQFKIWEQPQIFYKGWEISGIRIEGEMSKGRFTIWGPVKGNGPEDSSFQAGKVIYDQKAGKIFLLDNPVLVQDKNELTAAEIEYDLKAEKFVLNNQTRFKGAEETK
ncbi:MAG: LptA/OstA family protein [Firmicutes bacterium]|nr:LptA/OstA family protein [Bacillota bacterium]